MSDGMVRAAELWHADVEREIFDLVPVVAATTEAPTPTTELESAWFDGGVSLGWALAMKALDGRKILDHDAMRADMIRVAADSGEQL